MKSFLIIGFHLVLSGVCYGQNETTPYNPNDIVSFADNTPHHIIAPEASTYGLISIGSIFLFVLYKYR